MSWISGGKRGLLYVLAAAVLFMVAVPAMAATVVKDDSILVNKTQVEGGKVDITDIKMTGSDSEKFVMIEKGAMQYAAQKGLNVGVTTNNTHISFPAAAIVNSDEWTKAANASTTYNFVIEMDDDFGLNLSQDLSQAAQAKLGCTKVSPDGVGIKMYLRGGNNSYTYIYSIDQDMTVIYDYIIGYRNANSRAPQKSLALAWADVERDFDSTKVTNVLLDSKVDLEAQTVEVRTPYTCGAYVLVSKNNADNTKTVFGSTPAAPGLSGEVNTNGVAAWAAANVAMMQEAAVVPSDLSGKNLNAPITRAEFAAYIVRLVKVSGDNTVANPFNDVKKDNPYYAEILAAANAGLVAGRTADTFAPNASITRQEMAVMFARALAHSNVVCSMDIGQLNTMPDAAKVADWAKGSAAICVNAGLIAGRDGGAFAPLATTTWTEAVVMLSRLSTMI